jgi:lysophospholipase L1-like esterase
MSDDRRRQVVRAAACTAAVLVALALGEAVLRITHWGVYEPRQDDYRLLKKEGEDFWYFDPSAPTTQQWDGDPYGNLPPGAKMTYVLNSRGLRGPEPDAARPKILFVGDSFTFGEGVAAEDLFAPRVERALASRFDPAPQAIPAAVPGYGTQHEAERLPQWIAEFAPKAVVVVFVPNDPIPLDQEELSPTVLIDRTAPSSLYLVRLFDAALGRSAQRRDVEDWYLSYYFGERREYWEKAKAELADMQRNSTAAGAKFAVVLFPLLHRLSERPFGKVHDALAAHCRALGAPFLDLTDALTVEPDQALWVHPTDHHPDARAHELAAQAIAPFVEALLR